MNFLSHERTALFIDGSNLYAAARALNFDIDYKRLLGEFSSQGRLIRAYYYTALIEDQEYSPIRPLVDWLDYNGYTMVTQTNQRIHRRRGPKKNQRKYGYRTRDRCHGTGRSRRSHSDLLW